MTVDGTDWQRSVGSNRLRDGGRAERWGLCGVVWLISLSSPDVAYLMGYSGFTFARPCSCGHSALAYDNCKIRSPKVVRWPSERLLSGYQLCVAMRVSRLQYGPSFHDKRSNYESKLCHPRSVVCPLVCLSRIPDNRGHFRQSSR